MPLRNKTTKAIISRTKAGNFNPSDNTWMIDNNQILPDPDLELEWVEPYPSLSRVAFKLCFTSAERIALKALRVTDPIIEDAFEILEDPQLTVVDLNLESNQNLLTYMVYLGVLTQ